MHKAHTYMQVNIYKEYILKENIIKCGLRKGGRGGYDQIKDKEQHRVTRWRGPQVGEILTTTKDRKVTEEQKEFQVRAGKSWPHAGWSAAPGLIH